MRKPGHKSAVDCLSLSAAKAAALAALFVPAVAIAQEPAPAVEPVPEVGAPAPAAEEGMVSESAPMTSEPAAERDERLTGAHLNVEGAVGFHRIAAAGGGGGGTYRIGFMTEFFNKDNFIRQGDGDVFAAGRLVFQATPIDYLSFNIGVSATSNNSSFGQPQAMLTQGDLNLGIRGYYPLNGWFSVGGDLSLYIPADFGTSGLSFDSTSVRPRLLATADIGAASDGAVALLTHINVGYRIDNTASGVPDGAKLTRIERFAYGVSDYDALELGVGFEYTDLPYVRPFLSYTMDLPVNGADGVCGNVGLDCYSDAGIGAAPKVLSLGARIEPIKDLGIQAGVDLGLTTRQAQGLPATAPYMVVLGLTWTIDSNKKGEDRIVEKVVEKEKIVEKEPVKGFVLGTVVDGQTLLPVTGALIEYTPTENTPQSSSMANGSFRSYGFKPGDKLVIRFSHPDYEPQELPLEVAEGEKQVQIKLKAIPKKGTMVGRISDAKDKPVTGAQVTISGPKEASTSVDAGGSFFQELPPGKYTITVKADGFLAAGKEVELKANEKLDMSIVMTPRPKKELATLRDEKIEIKEMVYFANNKADVLAKSYPLLDSVAAVLIENPQVVKLRIEGHTDDKGGDALNTKLSQERADSVRAYLIKKGVSASRLDAKGYGPTRPILPNTSNANRAINRRVEFNIVEQAPKK
jgi:outer membrane protein OmpA-like peptidoglycan-associated protein